jgi:hypothetical protein
VRRVRAIEFVALRTLSHGGGLHGLFTMALKAGSMAGLDSHFRNARSCRLSPLVAVSASRSQDRILLTVCREDHWPRQRLQVRGMREVGPEICLHLRFGEAEQRRMRFRDGTGFVADAAEQDRPGQGFQRQVVTRGATDMAGEIFHIRLGRSDCVALRTFKRLVLVFVVREAREFSPLCRLITRRAIASLQSGVDIDNCRHQPD